MSAAAPQVASLDTSEQVSVPRFAALLADYSQLLKLRVTSMVVATAWCGYFMATRKSGLPALSWRLVHSLIGIALVAGAAAALNQVMEHQADARMRRTQSRPLPARRMRAGHATIFGFALLAAGSVYLAVSTNLLTGYLALATAASYLIFYTPLKQVTSFCTFVGAFPGAMPAALGWTAVRGRLEWEALALFAIVLLWQFPHFFAIAWLYAEDYESGGIRMLPVVEKDGKSTTREIVLYSLSLIPVSIAPAVVGMTTLWYVPAALLLSVGYFWFGWQLRRLQLRPTSPHSKQAARELLRASIIYLPVLFAVMMVTAINYL